MPLMEDSYTHGNELTLYLTVGLEFEPCMKCHKG